MNVKAFNVCDVLDCIETLKHNPAAKENSKTEETDETTKCAREVNVNEKSLETEPVVTDERQKWVEAYGSGDIAPTQSGTQKVRDFLKRIGSLTSVGAENDSKMVLLTDARREEEAREIANTATFDELTYGYYHNTKWVRDWNGEYSVGKMRKEWVDMKKPRLCTYMKVAKEYSVWRWMKGSNIRKIHTPTKPWHQKLLYPAPPTPPPVEMRGITLRQLQAVVANVKRRCALEIWVNYKGERLSPDRVSLYEVDKYILRPFTVQRKESFVSCLPSTAGPQPPRFFVTHWWGEPVMDFVACIEQFVRDFGTNFREADEARGGGMTVDTPIWVCAYANNQWELGKAINDDPRESGFTRAMTTAEGRTIAILDKKGIIFNRIWCIYEMYLTPTERGLWAVYTAKKHKYKNQMDGEEERDAVGIIPGGCTSDIGMTAITREREKFFPFELIAKSLTVMVEDAEASVEIDRVNILNRITGNTGKRLNKAPIVTHDAYTALNDVLRATFVASQSTLQSAARESCENWEATIVALSKGRLKCRAEFNFGDREWSGLTAVRATQLVAHLPLTIETLTIVDGKFGAEFVDALIERVRVSTALIYLKLTDTLVGGRDEAGKEAGVRLAKVLASNTTIERLELLRTDLVGPENVVEWGDALVQNRTLKTFTLYGVAAEIDDELREKMNTNLVKDLVHQSSYRTELPL